MRRKTILTLILALVLVFSLAAEDAWYYGKEIAEFSFTGLRNVKESEVNEALYEYRYKPFSDELFNEIQKKLYMIEGIDFFTADAEKADSDGSAVRLSFGFYEVPMLSSISFEGNDAIKNRPLREGLTSLEVGRFYDPGRRSIFEGAVEEIRNLYYAKGFLDVPIEYEITENSEDNTFSIVFRISEGMQTRITKIQFSGNDHFDYSTLKKQVKSKVKSLFNNGYLDENQLKADVTNIITYYQTNGYIDVQVGEPVIEFVKSSSDKFLEAVVTFQITEGQQWFYGGMEVTGNTIFSDSQIQAAQSMKVGSVLNLEAVQSEYSSIADLYYNDGYISNGMNINNIRDEESMTVKFFLDITEGPQAIIEQILISGLENTKEYVMRRELEIHPGDVFSKAKLITSAQNLYNTGLLANLDYELMYGQSSDGVILDFKLVEGKTMDIQFGATFGGTLNGFPVSGFVQWSDRNLGGRGQKLDVNLTLSPDTQSIALTFGDNWFKDYRWANSFTFGFTHTRYENELQLGEGATERYNGRNSSKTWPLGFSSADAWANSGNETPALKDLMKYDLLTFSLAYNSGYTFIYDVGRLTFSGGTSVSLNRAFYDEKYDPYERLIFKYGERWQFSNKLYVGVQWDGRDYITNTTKGYVLSTSFTYAGGLLGGLSNYNKVSASAAGYLRLFHFTTKEEKEKNIMLCVSTSGNWMLPQFYNNTEDGGFGLHDPKLGATKYEMLYIDGMTIGRGFNTVTDQAFLWDNMLEISYQLVENVVQAELFVSATGVNSELSQIKNGINWYFAAGGGLKLKIAGFPLGLYLVKNAYYRSSSTFTAGDRGFSWLGGAYFHGKSDTSGMSLVLAISTSLI